MRSLLDRIAPTGALRRLAEGETPRVSNMELFFDLVYVFSIIQLSHHLLEHLTPRGALEAATLFAAVWWAWNYTAWATNWLDPDHPAGRGLMVVLMACALAMAVAIPEAFGDRAGLFVAAYVTMALVRAGYMALLFRGRRMGRNYGQLAAWSALSGLLWIAGTALPEARLALWLAAVVADYVAPSAGFWLPGLGATPMSTWPLSGLHLLERNQQVFIIALGESVLLLGYALVETTVGPANLAAGAIGFLLIVSLWWLYFVRTTTEAEAAFEHVRDPTRLARATLAYSHGVMVGGAIVVAVGVELIVAHPSEPVHLPTVLVATLGPAIYLLGSAAFHGAVSRRVPWEHGLGALALALAGIAVLGLHGSGMALGAAVLAVLVGLAVLTRSSRPAPPASPA